MRDSKWSALNELSFSKVGRFFSLFCVLSAIASPAHSVSFTSLAHFNGTDGSLGFLEFDALYRLRPNVSFALGYNVAKAHLSSTQAKQSGSYDLHADGPEFFVRVAF